MARGGGKMKVTQKNSVRFPRNEERGKNNVAAVRNLLRGNKRLLQTGKERKKGK